MGPRLRYRFDRWWSQEEWDELVTRARASVPPRMACPMVIRDHMDDVVNPVNGLPYDSKRAYERAVRDAGCVIMGSEAPTERPHACPDVPGLERDIKDAMEQLNAGV